MVALTCEFCGGTLVTKEKGICECEFCGMQFDKTWVKEKIQEIRGTVQVEGTVEVTGKVQIEGGVNVANLIKRGWLALEEKDWIGGQKHFDEALDLDAECAEAYLGKFCAAVKASSMEAYFLTRPTQAQIESIKTNKNMQKALRFAGDTALAQALEEAILRDRERKTAFRARMPALREKTALAKGRVAYTKKHLIAVQADGTVLTSEEYSDFAGELKAWRGITAIAADEGYVLGLRIDGTVVAASHRSEDHIGSLSMAWAGDSSGQCNVGDWKEIVAVSAGKNHSVGLRADGTVVSTNSYYGEVSAWRDIVDVAAGDGYTVGLRSDGSVVAAGQNDEGQCDVSQWQDIVAVAAGENHTLGLCADGTVVATGRNYVKQCNVSQWRDVVEIVATQYTSIGLCADGQVVSTSHLSTEPRYQWHDVVAVAAYDSKMQGVYADGTLVNTYRDIEKWRLFKHLDEIKADREKLRTQWEEEKRLEEALCAEKERLKAEKRAARKAELEARKAALTAEMGNLKGLFTGKRRKEIEAELEALERQLRQDEE